LLFRLQIACIPLVWHEIAVINNPHSEKEYHASIYGFDNDESIPITFGDSILPLALILQAIGFSILFWRFKSKNNDN